MQSGVRLSIAVVGAWIAVVSSASGGIYISADSGADAIRLNDYRLNLIRLQRNTLQALPNRLDAPERAKYVEFFKTLKEKERAGSLTEQDRADLGGLLLRLGRDPAERRAGSDPSEAARVLANGGSRNFLVLCNLAVANHDLAKEYQDVNRMQEALLTQKHALDAWPAAWSDWSYDQWYFYRRVESLHLKLLETRFSEMRSETGRPQPWQTIDRIFPGFKMVGPSGEYEAGRVTPAAFDSLPPDAPWLVRELMMAYPTDARLYWLFGELLNACGRVEDALQVLDDLVDVNQLSNVRELMAHRRVLLERATLLRDLRNTDFVRNDQPGGISPLLIENLFWAMSPPPIMAVPVAGPAMIAAGWWSSTAAIEVLQRQERLGRPDALPALAAKSAPSTPEARVTYDLPDWKVLSVGFGAGLFVAFVVGLQRNEWKRRKQAALGRRQPVG